MSKGERIPVRPWNAVDYMNTPEALVGYLREMANDPENACIGHRHVLEIVREAHVRHGIDLNAVFMELFAHE